MESIKQIGVVSPLIVRPDPEGGYEILSGHRRLHAAQLAGLELSLIHISCTEKPYAVNPDTDTPVTENPAQLSTNRTSTKTINKREKTEIQHRYGSYENVLLSDMEYGKLRQEFRGDYQMRVERLSEYMASTGRS